MKKQENCDIHNRETKQLCSVIGKERGEELARVGMGNNAARKRREMALLKSSLMKQWTIVEK